MIYDNFYFFNIFNKIIFLDDFVAEKFINKDFKVYLNVMFVYQRF